MKKLSLVVLLLITLSTGSINSQNWKVLIDSTNFYNVKQDYKTALKWAKSALPKTEKEFGKNDSNYTNTLGIISEIYCNKGQLDSAIYYSNAQLVICRKIFNKDNPNLLKTICYLAYYYQSNGDYTNAELLNQEAYDSYNHLNNFLNPDFIAILNNLAYCYFKQSNFKKAELLYTEALDLSMRLYQTDNEDLASAYNNLGGFYDNIGNYKKAEPLYQKAIEIRRRLYKSDNPYLALSIHNMAVFYEGRGNYYKAEQLFNEALEIRRRLYKSDNADLACSINSIAGIYNRSGDFNRAEPLFIESMEMYRHLYPKDDENLAWSLNNTAVFYFDRGDYQKAEPLFKEALAMKRRIYKGNNPELAASLNNSAYFYYDKGELDKAEPLYIEALNMYRRLFPNDNQNLATNINNLACFYNDCRDFKKAEPLFIEALDMRRRLFQTDHPDLATSIFDVAGFYNGSGDFTKAEQLYIEALDMRRRLFKTDHPDLATSLSNTAYFYDKHGDLTKAEPLYIEALNMYSKIVNNYFPALSEIEKERFWNKYKDNFERFNAFAIKRINENPKITCDMYNYQLNTKALLFNSTSKIKRRISNSKDTPLKEKYRRWVALKEQLVDYYSYTKKRIDKEMINLDSLNNAANELEKEISRKSELFAESYEKMIIVWSDIRSFLKPDEAAIEIVRFRVNKNNTKDDSVFYAALIITYQTTEHPEIVILKNGYDLENKFLELYSNSILLSSGQNHKDFIDTVSYSKYWKPIAEKLKDIKKVYLSPDKVYNLINLQSLFNPDTKKYLLEEIGIQILNSTKEIVINFHKGQEETKMLNSAVLFGNPSYDLNKKERIEVFSQYKSVPDESIAALRNITLRGKISNLPATEKEVTNIEKFLKGKNWLVNSYLGKNAVKSAVKTLESPRVLHIATHGIYLPDVAKDDEAEIGTNKKRIPENPLLQSGLLFSGAANFSLDPEYPLMDQDNGILTAYEAMNLDLDHTELVVLSACETGLGEVKNGEGVYGLQRAFQIAGAKTVLISLWNVADEQTNDLMTAFYSNWVSGMTKREAFREAQFEIYKKYKSPYYWGAFVMVGE